ncbi:MAG: type 1 glutamine amidotransferase [Deltaproteobacteria bacterium]|nr:type 1 glutamine amidotransferase [Deltaproteobacteria bacterium]
MHAHLLQHVPFEGLGSIEPWLKEAGYAVTETRLFEGAPLPEVQAVDLLIAMGGPMSINDEGEFPWLSDEKRFIRETVRAGKAVLGVCLGAQLIASALGASVFRNPVPEIGWFPIQAVPPPPEGSVFRFPDGVEVFHWHGETFALPPGAIRLASSAGCRNQAFQFGPSVIGLQFHLETTPASAQEIVAHCADELAFPSATVQSAAEILAAAPAKYRTINALMADVLGYLSRDIR